MLSLPQSPNLSQSSNSSRRWLLPLVGVGLFVAVTPLLLLSTTTLPTIVWDKESISVPCEVEQAAKPVTTGGAAHDASVTGQHPGAWEAFSAMMPALRKVQTAELPEEELEDDTNWYLDRIKAGREEFDWPRIKHLFVFGDSMSEHSDAYHRWNENPSSLGLWPHLKWCDFLHMLYRNQKITSYWSFAWGGAVINETIVPPFRPEWGDLSTQIAKFERAWPAGPTTEHPTWRGNDTLVTLLIGQNDVKALARDFPRDQHESLMRQLVGSMTDTMRHLHSLGVRSFLVMTSPPIELNPEAHLPGHGGYHDRHMTAADAIYINKLIRAAALELERELSDANVMLFDFEAFHRLYTTFPEAFGLTDTERYNMVIHGAKPDLGQMGFVYSDYTGHTSAQTTRIVAAAVNGFLLRHSRSFQASTANVTTLVEE
ncbi:hypothetical protein JCM24511_07423 [Saitozyma sp. JCM 24511]|nr:hypothetical protein JCM24511_07423 [Saitozyma sp. JCM 24511]